MNWQSSALELPRISAYQLNENMITVLMHISDFNYMIIFAFELLAVYWFHLSFSKPKQMHRSGDNCSSRENANHSESSVFHWLSRTPSKLKLVISLQIIFGIGYHVLQWLSCLFWSEPLGPPRLTEWVASLITGFRSPWDIMPLCAPQHPSISCRLHDPNSIANFRPAVWLPILIKHRHFYKFLLRTAV